MLSHMQTMLVVFHARGLVLTWMRTDSGVRESTSPSRVTSVTGMALLVFFLHQALHSARHMSLFAIVAAPIIARETTPWFEARRPALRDRWREIAREQAALRSPLVYFPALCTLFVALSLAGALPFPRTLDDLQLSRGAAEFIATHQDRFGRLFNTDGLGGSLVYRFWPGLRIFVDDRTAVYGDDFMLRRYYRVLYGQRGWRKVLEKYGVTAAVVDLGTQCAALLRPSPEWVVVHEARLNAIFLRRGASGARRRRTGSYPPQLLTSTPSALMPAMMRSGRTRAGGQS